MKPPTMKTRIQSIPSTLYIRFKCKALPIYLNHCFAGKTHTQISSEQSESIGGRAPS